MQQLSLKENPKAYSYQVLKDNQEDGVIGKRFVFRFLTSEKGKKLNGQHCTVVGADEDLFNGRYHCRLNDGRVVKAKLCNLAIPDSCIIHQMDGYQEEDLIPPTELLPYLERAILWGINRKFGKDTRADAVHRIEVMKKYRVAMLEADSKLGKIARRKKRLQVLATSEEERIDPSKIPCGDDRYYCKDKPGLTDVVTAHYNVMRGVRYACCGDSVVDFRRFNFGLSGASYLPECIICLDDITVDDKHVLKLACQHIFHDECISDWIENRGKTACPTCNQEMPVKSMGKEYRKNYENQLQLRLQEFIMSGFCEKCVSIFLERDPVYYYSSSSSPDESTVVNCSVLDKLPKENECRQALGNARGGTVVNGRTRGDWVSSKYPQLQPGYYDAASKSS